MTPSSGHDARVLITSPTGGDDPALYAPIEDDEEAADFVFCCFFHTTEQRAAFLARLRESAKEPPATADDRTALQSVLSDEYARQLADGRTEDALVTLARWWMRGMRRGYHAYNLKTAYAPWNASCIVSFTELDGPTMKANIARALDLLREEKSRVLDFFGFPGA